LGFGLGVRTTLDHPKVLLQFTTCRNMRAKYTTVIARIEKIIVYAQILAGNRL
jgi:hypothetical protein